MELYSGEVDKDLTREEVTSEFASYRQKALVDDGVVRSGELERVWAPLFQVFQTPVAIHIPSWIGEHPVLFTQHEYYEHFSSRIPLRNSSQSNYGQFFRTIVRCLASSKAIIRGIEIDCEIVNSFRGWQTSAWQQVKLEHLQTLSFTSYEFWDAQEHDGSYERDNAIANAVNQFLTKCSSDLMVLGVERYVDHPRIRTPSLSASGIFGLRSLSLEGVRIRSDLLAHDISNMPFLRKIYLRDCNTDPAAYFWKPILIAVHYHGNITSFEMEKCWLKGGEYEGRFFFNLHEYTFDEDVARLSNDEDKDLYRYFADRGPWTNLLEDRYA